MTGKYINKGNDGFASVRKSNFVDKSMLIAEVNSVLCTEDRYMCVTRARRFGKSVAIKMLNAYYDKSCHSRELFEGLQISQHPEFENHLNQYPVLYLDITDFVTKYGKDRHIVQQMKQDICDELLSMYPEVTMQNNDDLMDLLVSIVNRTGERFICLIDEWDALCREGYEKQMDEYVDFLRRLFKGSKTEYVFACAYMTGILPIKRYNTQSALNNFEEYTMLSPSRLAPYFGFTASEVTDLCQKASMDIQEMKRWYDGYELGTVSAMYNPYAVMRALKRKSFESYWTSTNTFESLKQYITMNYEGLKDDIVNALNDIPVKVSTLRFSNDMHRIDCKDDVLTLLCHLGYLSYNNQTHSASIPNFEVRQEFDIAIADTQWKEVINALQQSDMLLDHVLNGENQQVATSIEQIHQENTSILKYNDENALACVLSLAFYTARNKYQFHREFPTGKGFADLVLIPHRHVDAPAILLELKYNKTAESAISQIKRQQYGSTLLKYVGEVILVGIDYDKKTKHHSCIIERVIQNASCHSVHSTGIRKTDNKRTTNGQQTLTADQQRIIKLLSEGEKSLLELMAVTTYKKRDSFRQSVLNPLINTQRVAMTHPETPNHRNQRYILINE